MLAADVWELFVVDGMMAAFHQKRSFKTNNVGQHALLPCDEETYAAEASFVCPSSQSLAQFDERLFADDESQFSSFCYRIEAVRILARVLDLTGAHESHPDQIQAVDNALAGWSHHVPFAKLEIVDGYGEIDELMFQAQMIIQVANILLHFPRSALVSVVAIPANLACAQQG